jgi:hypothetical protein
VRVEGFDAERSATYQMAEASPAVEDRTPGRLICLGLDSLTMPVMFGLQSVIVTPPAPLPKSAGLAFL